MLATRNGHYLGAAGRQELILTKEWGLSFAEIRFMCLAARLLRMARPTLPLDFPLVSVADTPTPSAGSRCCHSQTAAAGRSKGLRGWAEEPPFPQPCGLRQR